MGFFSNLWNGIKNGVSNVWNKIKDTATSVWHNNIKPFVSKIPLVGDKIVTGVEGLGNAINSGANAVGKLASGNVGGAVKEGIGAFNAGKEALGKLTSIGQGAPNGMKKGGMVLTQAGTGGTRPFVMHDGVAKRSFGRC